MQTAKEYYLAYKPYQTLTQFSPQPGKRSLRDFFSLPADIYPVGRLDYDSEGLLILTNDGNINHRLLNPEFSHEREYLVQVEGIPDGETLERLAAGVSIAVDGRQHRCRPCRVSLLTGEPLVPARYPPIRFRKQVPTSWIRIILTEGKNRQVRRMTAAVGYPTLRLIRTRIENISLGHMQPGDLVKISGDELYRALFGKGSAGRKKV